MSLTSLLDSSGNPVSGALVAEDHRVFTNGTFGELSIEPIDQVKLLGGYRYKKHSMFGHEEKEHRITSYNVCYTKLLRLRYERRQSYRFSSRSLP